MSVLRLFCIFCISISIVSCFATKQQPALNKTPASDFSHLMPIIDSAAFDIMRQDPFLTNTFSFAESDTMMSSVYSLYLWGKNHFLHFSPNKGYFKNQPGTAYIIFQSKKPGVGDALKQAWLKQTKDSLISYDFKGPDFVLTEIIGARHGSIGKTASNHLIPMLSSYSAATYKNWGLPDTAESNMSDFIQKVDKKVATKLFERIQSVDLIVTNAELELLRSMLLMNGYNQDLKAFTKAGEPTINYTVDEKPGKSKVQKINILLSEEVPEKIISLGRSGQITFSGKEADFVFN